MVFRIAFLSICTALSVSSLSVLAQCQCNCKQVSYYGYSTGGDTSCWDVDQPTVLSGLRTNGGIPGGGYLHGGTAMVKRYSYNGCTLGCQAGVSSELQEADRGQPRNRMVSGELPLYSCGSTPQNSGDPQLGGCG